MEEITKQENADLIQDFCFMQALYSASSKAVNTKDVGNLRYKLDRILERNFIENGSDRMRLNILGEEVGSITVCTDKPSYVVVDDKAFNKWAAENHYGTIHYTLNEAAIPKKVIDDMFAKHPEWFNEELTMKEKLENISCIGDNEVFDNNTGEIIPGAVFAKGGNIKNIRLNKFDANKVFRTMAGHGLISADIAYTLED